MEFILTGEAGEQRRLVEALENFCREKNVPAAARQATDLALEEHLTNVLSYGFAPGVAPWIAVRLRVKNDALHVEIADTGKPHDPLATPLVDTSVPLAEKPIGGLGVHLMRQFMDTLDYAREGGMNVLRMTKRFGA